MLSPECLKTTWLTFNFYFKDHFNIYPIYLKTFYFYLFCIFIWYTSLRFRAIFVKEFDQLEISLWEYLETVLVSCFLSQKLWLELFERIPYIALTGMEKNSLSRRTRIFGCKTKFSLFSILSKVSHMSLDSWGSC